MVFEPEGSEKKVEWARGLAAALGNSKIQATKNKKIPIPKLGKYQTGAAGFFSSKLAVYGLRFSF